MSTSSSPFLWLSRMATRSRPVLTAMLPLATAVRMAADALLVMQASNCNAQIPAKIYEYLRAGKPILALTDPEWRAKLFDNAVDQLLSLLDEQTR